MGSALGVADTGSLADGYLVLLRYVAGELTFSYTPRRSKRRNGSPSYPMTTTVLPL